MSGHGRAAPAGLVLREAGSADARAIHELLLTLSAGSLRRRFTGATPTADRILQLSRVGAGVVSVIASADSAPGEVVGEARFVRGDDDPDDAAELAVVVRDDLQHRGLGAALLDRIVQVAAACGVRRLRADVMVENFPMLKLLSRYGMVVTTPAEDGVVGVEISTDGEVLGWPEHTCGPKVLVEGGSWVAGPEMQRLLATGADVRQCIGPKPAWGRSCPLLTHGRCRAVEDADEIVVRLQQGESVAEEIALRRPPRP
ncbi:GNAT family N-acetyltransferase [Kineosporia sp. R_H_3]|uniref:GNAT family N-acetyltransferase n=1 Tax=Kineosporia sp. R_H_3 TaxID=1961848 RepID=UPI00130464C9|nr:GNAT family N-acetyltransferase [Kineosporia sp. R_H_3]